MYFVATLFAQTNKNPHTNNHTQERGQKTWPENMKNTHKNNMS